MHARLPAGPLGALFGMGGSQASTDLNCGSCQGPEFVSTFCFGHPMCYGFARWTKQQHCFARGHGRC